MHHNECHISLRCTRNHVFDEVAVPGSIDYCVMPFLSVELLCCACNRYTTLTLLLLTVHVKSKRKRTLAQTLSFLLQLIELTLRKPSELENEPTSCSALAAVD